MSVCTLCSGNGYIAVKDLKEGSVKEVDCWMCGSTGEYDASRYAANDLPRTEVPNQDPEL